MMFLKYSNGSLFWINEEFDAIECFDLLKEKIVTSFPFTSPTKISPYFKIDSYRIKGEKPIFYPNFFAVTQNGYAIQRIGSCSSICSIGQNTTLYSIETKEIIELIEDEKRSCLYWIEVPFGKMPWQESHLCRFDLNSKTIDFISQEANVSILSIKMSAIGLTCFSDKDGYYLPYYYDKKLVSLCKLPLFFDSIKPCWNLSISQLEEMPDEKFLFRKIALGKETLILYDRKKDHIEELSFSLTVIHEFLLIDEKIFILGESSLMSKTLIEWDLASCSYRTLIAPNMIDLNPPFDLVGEVVASIPTLLAIPKAQQPPYKTIMRIHGGPTSSIESTFSEETNHFCKLGYLVVFPNYRGSSGFGRAHREALSMQYGQVDVIDCKKVADKLIQMGTINQKYLYVKGKSSGGFTALLLLATTSIFQKGIIYCPVTQKQALDRYLLTLIKESDFPTKTLLNVRLPIILFQGGKDPVISQKETDYFVEELQKVNPDCQYYVFEEMGHSFKNQAVIQKCLQLEEDFIVD